MQCLTYNMEPGTNGKKFWIIIIIFIIFFSVPSLIRIYRIRGLFLSADIRRDAIAANVAMREREGIGATDLELTEIESLSGDNTFYFEYSYHHPGVGSEGKSYAVEFEDGQLKRITPI